MGYWLKTLPIAIETVVYENLVADFEHAHQAGVESEDVDLAAEQFLDVEHDALHLDVVDVVLGLIIEGDGA